MKRPDLPELADTQRRYVEDTIRARLASPGIQRCARPRGGGGRLVAGVLIAAAIAAAAFLLSR